MGRGWLSDFFLNIALFTEASRQTENFLIPTSVANGEKKKKTLIKNFLIPRGRVG